MADTPISGLPAASAIADADLYAGVQGGVTVKFTHTQLAAYFQAEFAGYLAVPGDYGDIVVDTDLVWNIDPAVLTAFMRTVLDDATAADARTTLLAAARTQIDCMSWYIPTVEDKTYKLVVNCPFGYTVDEVTTDAESGTCTITGKINTTALGGTANSASTTETTQAHASANVSAVGDDFQITASANAACLGLTITVKITRVLA